MYPTFFGTRQYGKGVVSVFGCAYPAGFGSLKAVTNCFWSRKVGHINGLFALEMKAVATFWDVEKIKQMEEWQAEYLAP